MATYASELGKCYNKTPDGFYRLYKVDGMWAIYLVSKGDSGRLEATHGGYISDPDNFYIGVDALIEEIACLAYEFGF